MKWRVYAFERAMQWKQVAFSEQLIMGKDTRDPDSLIHTVRQIGRIPHAISSRDAARTSSCEKPGGFSEGRLQPSGMRNAG